MKLLHLKVVLAAIDADESSRDTLRAARELATAAGATLHVVHATPTHTRKDATAPAVTDGADNVLELFERSDMKRFGTSLEIIAGEPTHVIRCTRGPFQHVARRIGSGTLVGVRLTENGKGRCRGRQRHGGVDRAVRRCGKARRIASSAG